MDVRLAATRSLRSGARRVKALRSEDSASRLTGTKPHPSAIETATNRHPTGNEVQRQLRTITDGGRQTVTMTTAPGGRRRRARAESRCKAPCQHQDARTQP